MKKALGFVLGGLLATGSIGAYAQTLTVGMNTGDAGILDPHFATSTSDKGLLHWMFNGLVRIAPGDIPATLQRETPVARQCG